MRYCAYYSWYAVSCFIYFQVYLNSLYDILPRHTVSWSSMYYSLYCLLVSSRYYYYYYTTTIVLQYYFALFYMKHSTAVLIIWGLLLSFWYVTDKPWCYFLTIDRTLEKNDGFIHVLCSLASRQDVHGFVLFAWEHWTVSSRSSELQSELKPTCFISIYAT